MKPQKTWEDIAERASREKDPQKLSELTNKLLDALDQQPEQQQTKLDSKPKEQSERAAMKSA